MPVSASSHSQLRGSGASLPTPQGIQEPSLKATKDAFRYLDLVKSKLAAQPQLYLDFLDIMQKFKKQTIDIHDMLKQVSNLFKEVPELIVALSRFLPPGNKVEVQKNDQGYASQVSVSIPTSPTGTINSDPQSKEENEIPVYTINIFIQ